MKVALVYTSTTPELIQTIETEIVKQLGDQVQMIHYEDPSILKETIEAGKVQKYAAARLIRLYMKAIEADAEAIINLCSSVGEVADAAQSIARFTGVPIVRVDEEMCREAVRKGKRIGVMATLASTLEPTKGTLTRVAREMGKDIVLVDGLVVGAFGLNQEEFKAKMLEQAMQIKDEVDVLLFAQGSMAYCEAYIAQECNITVLSSPRFGAQELKKALVTKGVL